MKFSYSWLSDYIKEAPSAEEVSAILSAKSLEVEEIHGDILDVKILPHRSHDCMSHRGLAREIATVCDLQLKEKVIPHFVGIDIAPPMVTVEDATRCARYLGVRVEGVKVEPSPLWLKEKLESIGQRSISNIVDITNFVLHDIGQPLHAFDADKVVGAITVRLAKEGETMTTLDGKEIVMKGQETVIADEEGILALGGIKGGTKAIVDEHTKHIIFESANFNSTWTRKISALHGIRTDASKRFESGITSELAEEGLHCAVFLLQEMNATCSVSGSTDIYPKKEVKYSIGFTTDEVNSLLGSSYAEEEIIRVLTKERMHVEVIENPRALILEKAASCEGLAYKRGASVLHDSPRLVDCSSLISWLYVQGGFSIPRVSIDQFAFGQEITKEELLPGDLIFTNTKDLIHEGGIHYETKEWLPGTKIEHGIDHVGMYLGDGKILHASFRKNSSVVDDLATSSQFQQELYYRRMIRHEGRRLKVTVPHDRLDIRIKHDLIEEVGRVMGYDALPAVLPDLSKKKHSTGLPHKRLYYETKIKNILIDAGYSEMYTYTFGDEGEVSILKGLAQDKEKLRTTLAKGVLGGLTLNLHNAPLLGLDTIRVFEFGNVFSHESERRYITLAVDDGKKKSAFMDEIEFILAAIKRGLFVDAISYEVFSGKPCCVEIDFDTLIASLPEPTTYEPLTQITSLSSYQSVSPYPFISRDIACWTPFGTSWEDVHAIALQVVDPYIVRIDCFDTFTKDIESEEGGVKKMTSFAFRIVLQSKEKTLTDEEANTTAEKVYTLLKEKGYQIR